MGSRRHGLKTKQDLCHIGSPNECCIKQKHAAALKLENRSESAAEASYEAPDPRVPVALVNDNEYTDDQRKDTAPQQYAAPCWCMPAKLAGEVIVQRIALP